MYYVYVLISPIDNKPFYVGKGKGNRFRQHWTWSCQKGGNKFKDRVIAKITDSGLEPLVEFPYKDIESEEEAYRLESDLIKFYGRRGKDTDGILTNICLDGGAPPSRFGSENGFYGKTHSAEAKKTFAENASKQWKGHKQSAEHIARRVASFDWEAQRQRRIKFNKTDKMRAITAQSNKDKGRAKTKNRMKTKFEIFSSIIKKLEEGFEVKIIRSELCVSYLLVWTINKKFDYYKELIQEINAEQKQNEG